MSSASWVPLGSHFFQQTRVYASGSRWDANLDLSGSIVARAPFAGPVAVTRDETQMHDLRSSLDDDIVIYSSAGELLGRAHRDGVAGSLVFMGWSGRELLYCVYETGVIDV